jgi:hypothetical protein
MAGVLRRHEERSSESGVERILEKRPSRERTEFLTESLGNHIRQLTLHRRAAYDRARTYRRDGQLVPGSLRDEIAENGRQLQHALQGYSDATQVLRAPPP